MNIVLSGIYYPVAILRYFEAAIKRNKDLNVFTVGPYTGTWIPWNGGMTVNVPVEVTSPDLPLNPKQQEFNIKDIENKLPFEPDLWLQIDAGFSFKGKPSKGKNFVVGTDPHALVYDYVRSISDKFFCMQTPYMKDTDIYLPYAYDPIWHSYDKDLESNEYDLVFCGLQYKQRVEIFEYLKLRGYKIINTIGPAYNEAKFLYHKASMSINWSSKLDLTARVFELLGMKRLAIVNRVPDLGKFFTDKKDLVVFETMVQVASKVIYYLENPDKAKEIAENGHETVKEHTWDNRIKSILEYV